MVKQAIRLEITLQLRNHNFQILQKLKSILFNAERLE